MTIPNDYVETTRSVGTQTGVDDDSTSESDSEELKHIVFEEQLKKRIEELKKKVNELRSSLNLNTNEPVPSCSHHHSSPNAESRNTDADGVDEDSDDDDVQPVNFVLSDEENTLSDEENTSDVPEYHNYPSDTEMTPIGIGYAKVPSRLLRDLDWSSYSAVTRKLLSAVFPRRILATHCLSGKRSPAFPDKPAKKRLNPVLVNDIVTTVSNRCNISEKYVRTVITIKCCDESRLLRKRQRKESDRRNSNNENKPPATAPPPPATSSDESS